MATGKRSDDRCGVRSASEKTAWTPASARRGGIDCPDQGMGVLAADERRVQHARQMDVIDKAGATAQQRPVLVTRHARAEPARRPVVHP